MTQVMTATRAAGQARLEQFSAKMGRDYAQGRNFDRGPAGGEQGDAAEGRAALCL